MSTKWQSLIFYTTFDVDPWIQNFDFLKYMRIKKLQIRVDKKRAYNVTKLLMTSMFAICKSIYLFNSAISEKLLILIAQCIFLGMFISMQFTLLLASCNKKKIIGRSAKTQYFQIYTCILRGMELFYSQQLLQWKETFLKPNYGAQVASAVLWWNNRHLGQM